MGVGGSQGRAPVPGCGQRTPTVLLSGFDLGWSRSRPLCLSPQITELRQKLADLQKQVTDLEAEREQKQRDFDRKLLLAKSKIEMEEASVTAGPRGVSSGGLLRPPGGAHPRGQDSGGPRAPAQALVLKGRVAVAKALPAPCPSFPSKSRRFGLPVVFLYFLVFQKKNILFN